MALGADFRPLTLTFLALLQTTCLSVGTAQESNNAVPAAPAVRTWSDASGTFSTQATFVELAGGQVTLKRPDGGLVAVALEKLSDADQKYVGSLTAPKPAPPSVSRYSATFRPGKTLAESDFYGLSCAKGTASQLAQAISRGSLNASVIDTGDTVVVYGCKQAKIVGWAISFWPGKDPNSVYQRMLGERRGANPSATGVKVEGAEVWSAVGIHCCAHYSKGGSADGCAIRWNEDGTKQFYRNYARGLSCLFEQDRVRAVKEGPEPALHLMNGWEIEKSLVGTGAAKGDSRAAAALDEIEKIENEFSTGDRAFHEIHKKVFTAMVAAHTRAALGRQLDKIRADQEANAQAMEDLRQAMANNPASKTLLYSAANNYLPVEVH